MKKLCIFFSLVVILLGSFSYKSALTSIYGSIEPPESAKLVWAINGKDSLSVVPETGKFSIAVTPGTWVIHVQAVSPYKDMIIDNIVVAEGKSTNAGVIRMGK